MWSKSHSGRQFFQKLEVSDITALKATSQEALENVRQLCVVISQQFVFLFLLLLSITRLSLVALSLWGRSEFPPIKMSIDLQFDRPFGDIVTKSRA